MELRKQRKNFITLLELIKANPDLEVLPMVDTECVGGDDYSHWMAEWGMAEVIEYCIRDERVYFKDEFDEMVDDWVNNNYTDLKKLTDDELQKLAKDEISGYEWVQAIVVRIGPV